MPPADVRRPLATVSASRFDGGDADFIDYWNQLRTIWTSRWWVIGMTVAAMLAAAAWSLTRPPIYSSVAVVHVSTAGFATNAERERTLTDRYHDVAMSSAMIREAADELARRGHQRPGGVWLASRGKGDPTDPFTVPIALEVQAGSADDARLAADVWAQTFVKEVARMSALAKSTSIDVTEYSAAAAKLADAVHGLERAWSRPPSTTAQAARVAALESSRRAESAEYDRAETAARATLQALTRKVDEIRQAKADPTLDVGLAAPATLPTAAESRQTIRDVVSAGLMACLLSSVVTLMLAAIRRTS